MKKLLTLTVLMATLAMTHAELTTKEFDQLKTWATNQGYTYDGIAKRFNCFAFSNHSTNMVTLVPTSSDTADEAINALIASIATCRLIAETAPNEQPVAVAPAVSQSVAVAPLT